MIIAANFKCNHTRASFKAYISELDEFLKDLANKPKVIIAPPASAFSEEAPKYFAQAAQNIYPCINGAFTGEIGLEQLNEFGINTVILGHCERRNLGESEEFLSRKFAFAKEHDLEIIYCIGESADEYAAGNRFNSCAKQLELIDCTYSKLIIAYEPIYSIGKQAATLQDITSMIAHLRSLSPAKLLYGGSVNASNIAEITSIADGVLVGSASLKAANFIELIKGALK